MTNHALYLFAVVVAAFSTGEVMAQLPVATVNDSAEIRLKYMQSAGETYTVNLGDNSMATFLSEPVLRFTNPVSGVIDGGLFVWQDQAKRPVAIAQFFIAPRTEKLWLHEFQSLASEPLKFTYDGRVVWSPSKAGVVFEPLAGAQPPAESREARLTQMRQIARRFSVKDDFEGAASDELRLLATPLARYSSDSTLDGALFTFAHGTDPELLIMIETQAEEASSGKAVSTTAAKARDLRWRVALAPMTGYAIAAQLDGQDFWSVPWRQAPYPLTATFRNFAFPPQ